MVRSVDFRSIGRVSIGSRSRQNGVSVSLNPTAKRLIKHRPIFGSALSAIRSVFRMCSVDGSVCGRSIGRRVLLWGRQRVVGHNSIIVR